MTSPAHPTVPMTDLIEFRTGFRLRPEDPPRPEECIYVITTLRLDPKAQSYREKRTWGWFNELHEAVSAVRKNDGDIFETGSFDAAVIEETPWGTIGIPDREWWFNAQYDPYARTHTVTPCKRPKYFASTLGFGMG